MPCPAWLPESTSFSNTAGSRSTTFNDTEKAKMDDSDHKLSDITRQFGRSYSKLANFALEKEVMCLDFKWRLES